MRWRVFIGLQCVLLLVLGGVVYLHQDRVIVLKKPPLSIAKWYKPQNKRQVWLHTMFKLRREMLAVEMYAAAQDGGNLNTWAAKLGADYNKIAEMVPEWQSRVAPAILATLQKSAADKRYNDVSTSLRALKENCQSCHTDFRAVTATLYRAPDFAKIKTVGATPLGEHMQGLSQQVNRIKIAFVDERPAAALSALSDLKADMNTLGYACARCHKKVSRTYPSEKMNDALAILEQSLKTGTLQDKGRALGTLAVMACAECHGTHRLSFDAKSLFGKKPDWGQLLKH